MDVIGGAPDVMVVADDCSVQRWLPLVKACVKAGVVHTRREETVDCPLTNWRRL